MSKKIRIALLCVSLALVVAGGAVIGVYIADRISSGQSDKYYNYEISEFYHDQAHVFMQPLEPTENDAVTVRIRVAHGNVKEASLRYTLDVDAVNQTDAKYNDVKMVWDGKDETGYYDYFAGVIPAQKSPYRYHFKLSNNLETIYVNGQDSFSQGKEFATVSNDWFVMPGFTTPDWAKGALWYSIMPDSFYNGDVLGDSLNGGNVTQNAWGNNHTGSNDWFGGDLQGIIDKIDYLKSYGVEAVFINPIWLTTHNAGYGSFDLEQVNGVLGNEAKLSELVDKLHESGMKLMLDAVFRYTNLTGNLYNSADYFPAVTNENGVIIGGKNVGQLFYEMFQRDEAGNPVMEWGGPVFDFSSPATRQYLFTSVTSVLQYYIDKFDIDGWRMDVGNSLTGTQEGNWKTNEEIIKDMRRYIKKYGDDKLFLSEHATGALIYDYSFDSKWTHYDYAEPMRAYISDKKSENVLMDGLYGAIVKSPRPIANSLYNYTASHDLSKTANLSDDVNRITAANLITMTYVGAPSVLFGDEVGMTGKANPGVNEYAPSSFGSMNWYEREYNRKIYNNYRAVTSFRSAHRDVFTDGAYVTLLTDIVNHVIAFGRFNSAGQVITVTNVNDKTVKGVEIEVRRAGIKDGTTLTDALSGNKYKVKGGFVTVDVLPGGALLSSAGEAYAAADLQTYYIDGGKGSITALGDSKVKLDGNVEISDARIRGSFAGNTLLGNGKLDFTYTDGKITALIAADTDSGANAYAVVIDGGKATVYARKENKVNKITEFTAAKGSELSVVRTDDNVYKTYLGGTLVAESSATVPAPQRVYALIGGKGTAENVQVAYLPEQLESAFDTDFGSQNTVFGSESVSLSGGKLVVISGSEASGVQSVAPMRDFTYETSLHLDSAAEAGIMLGYDADNALRLYADGTHVALALNVRGHRNIVASNSFAGDDIILTLEKIGAHYVGKYSTDGETWNTLGSELTVNYSEINAGVYTTGKASFDYARFGDGSSYTAYRNYGLMNLTPTVNIAGYNCLSVEQGNWAAVIGGYGVKDKKPAVMSGSENYTDFKADFSFTVDEIDESGYVGVSFGTDFLAALYGDGKVKLTRGEEVLAEKQVAESKEYRLIVSVKGGNIDVWQGNDPEHLFTASAQAISGKVKYVSDGAAWSFTSHNESGYGYGWQQSMGNVSVVRSGSGEQAVTNVSMSSTENFAYAGLLNEGYTDMFFAGNFMLTETNPVRKAKAGLLIGGTAGSTYLKDGYLVSLDSAGNIRLESKDGVIAQGKAEYNAASFYAMIIVQKGKLEVYTDDFGAHSTEPVFTHTLPELRGGTVNLYSEYARAKIRNVYAYALGESEDYTLLPAYTERVMSEPPLPDPDVNDTVVTSPVSVAFDSREAVAKFHKYNGGDWEFDGGVLYAYPGAGNWDQGATMAAGRSGQSFDLSVEMKYSGPGWCGLLIGKSGTTANHQAGGLLLYMGNDGGITLFDGADVQRMSPTKGADGFVKLRIEQRVSGGKHVVRIYDGSVVGGEPLYSFNIEDTERPNATSGYISLVCGTNGDGVGQFRNFSYVPR